MDQEPGGDRPPGSAKLGFRAHYWTACNSAPMGHKVMLSVRTLFHSLIAKPFASKKRRIFTLSHSRTSSRIGIRTLSESSLNTVRRAIWVMYLFSETEM